MRGGIYLGTMTTTVWSPFLMVTVIRRVWMPLHDQSKSSSPSMDIKWILRRKLWISPFLFADLRLLLFQFFRPRPVNYGLKSRQRSVEHIRRVQASLAIFKNDH